jgi:osmotically-inducible protein OsmY
MKTDNDLQRDVANELRWEPSVHGEEIAVAVRDGVVTLAGAVSSYARRYAATRAAERVAGVRAVADEIEVRLPGTSQRTDTELAHQVANALRWHVQVPEEQVKARVEHGWVTLEGEVEWEYQRRAAYRAVRDLTGIRGVSNLVTLKPRLSGFDVSQRIKEALRRQAELDATMIDVETTGGTVTLRGSVHSWTERRQAENAAWAAPGVSRVDDRLVVQP